MLQVLTIITVCYTMLVTLKQGAMMSRKLTTEEFIERARKVHGLDRYDYSNVEYTGMHNKVCIKCNCCGLDIMQTPHNHLKGHGCNSCAEEKTRLTTGQFVSRSKKIHNNKYDYSLVKYVNKRTKVCITCPIHGKFFQLAGSHLNGNGCEKCAIEKRTKKEKQFIKDAKKVHGDKYDYSKVEYTNAETKVCIICKQHGSFWQSAGAHLKGCGCPKCSNSKGENAIILFLSNNNVSFMAEKTFINCINKSSLRFDFYLPEHNLAIEYDGEQHYEAVKHFGGSFGLKEIQKRDKIKNDYCYQNGIILCRIMYNEDIESKIKEYIKVK